MVKTITIREVLVPEAEFQEYRRLKDAHIQLVESLKDILSRFRSCIGAGGEIEGDKEAIERALAILDKVNGGEP